MLWLLAAGQAALVLTDARYAAVLADGWPSPQCALPPSFSGMRGDGRARGSFAVLTIDLDRFKEVWPTSATCPSAS